MATVDLAKDEVFYSDGYDSIIIPDNFQSKRGGVTLDVTGYPHANIRAGHVIIKQTSTGEFKPMPLNEAGVEYAALPSGHTYYGHAIQSVQTSKAMVGVTRRGVVNPSIVDPEAGVFDMSGILDDLKVALPLIDYIGDNA